MALNINAIIIAIMEYRDNYESLQGYRAHYATASEVKYISELLLDNYQCEAKLDVDFDENIDTRYFA